jgi:NAD(P)H-hydrate epimerase
MKNNFYLSSKQIYQIDKLATEKYLIPSMILMENAGRLSAEFIKNFAKRKKFKKIIVFCGPGKNGGDGFVCARYLYIWQFDIKVITFVDKTKYQGDVLQNYEILKRLNVKIEKFDFEKVKKIINRYEIVVDAIFGIGLSRPVDGECAKAIELINKSNKIVFSIDIPSGLHSDTGEILGKVVKANYTLSMGFLKLAFMNKTAKKLCGKIVLIDIGYPHKLFKKI